MNFKKFDLSKCELKQSEMNKVLGGECTKTRDPGASCYHDHCEVLRDKCGKITGYGEVIEGPCD